jgi:molybdenum cofactor guanylyltransferase
MLHSAVLLAGGKSSRMGRDKGALLVEGEPLWQRQLNILRRTQPRELFISGPLDGPYANTGVRIVSDAEPHLGPLGGIAAALGECTTDWLLVLAVDLPFMRADYLLSLLQKAVEFDTGVIPAMGDTGLEPLAAVYPKRAHFIAEAKRASRQLKLADFTADLEARGWMKRLDVSAEEAGYFTNWNSPGDLERRA